MEKFGIIEIGNNYFVRTLTDHWVGRVVEQLPFSLVLEDAAWIADCGRLNEFMKNGKAQNMEIEVVGTVQVRYEAVLPWKHQLFKESV